MSWNHPAELSEELPQEHINKAVANFTKRLAVYMVVAAKVPMVVTLNNCSNSVHLQICILTSSPTDKLFLEPPTAIIADYEDNT